MIEKESSENCRLSDRMKSTTTQEGLSQILMLDVYHEDEHQCMSLVICAYYFETLLYNLLDPLILVHVELFLGLCIIVCILLSLCHTTIWINYDDGLIVIRQMLRRNDFPQATPT